MFNPIVTGVQINYYQICHRKLWLFSHNFQMEHRSELVEIGNIIHEHSYKTKTKSIELDGIKIDFYEKNKGIINEVKKSRAVKKADLWQVKYYIYHLRKIGIDVRGQIDYPLIRRREIVDLNKNGEKCIEEMVVEIERIKKQKKLPPVKGSKICKKCSYYEYCFV